MASKILKGLQAREGDEYLMDDLRDLEALLQDLNINPDLAEELSETLYDQLTQYTKGELLSDIQMMGLLSSMKVMVALHQSRPAPCLELLPGYGRLNPIRFPFPSPFPIQPCHGDASRNCD